MSAPGFAMQRMGDKRQAMMAAREGIDGEVANCGTID